MAGNRPARLDAIHHQNFALVVWTVVTGGMQKWGHAWVNGAGLRTRHGFIGRKFPINSLLMICFNFHVICTMDLEMEVYSI